MKVSGPRLQKHQWEANFAAAVDAHACKFCHQLGKDHKCTFHQCWNKQGCDVCERAQKKFAEQAGGSGHTMEQ